ncbi:WG repeat-containing protein [Bacteroides thetaiotaomicron]|uniref:WG repeat-containing protein n=1 Tax=Bacteroides thetaiotaomicron TaxID=818 RepID=UPI0018AA00C9|nr:WG repeat-containing protein [Bacteroides thetaiotaomicron]MDC2165500.1 WG repeat-containing protein [Bacteroides thetaiotaomicron]
MKTKIIIAILLLLPISACIYAQNTKLYIYYPDFDKDETFSGYVNANGEVIIPAGKYDNIFTPEFDKIAFVTIKGKKGVYAIDRNEKILFQVYNPEYGPDDISNGLFRIIQNNKIGFANMNGQIVIKPQFQFIYSFNENGFAIFCEQGTWHTPEVGINVIKGKWGAIDKKGKIIIPAIYDSGSENYLGKGDKFYKLNKQGKLELKVK